MTRRVVLAGIFGAIAMFIWMSLAHMVLPLGEAGIREIPNEPAVLGAMQTSIGGTSGFYLFPGMGLGPDATRQQKSAAMQQYGAKLASSPSGILIYHPAGAKVMEMKQLGTEFLTEFVQALLLAILLAMAGLSTFGARFGFVFFVAVLAAITTNVSYWNWYGFPSSYTAAYMFTAFMGYLCAGLVAASVVKTA